MMRSLFIFVLSFSIALPGWSLTPRQAARVQNYVKAVGLTEKNPTWKRFLREMGPQLPADLKRELELIVSENPKAKMPVPRITQLQEGSKQIVQLEFKNGADKLTLRFEGQGNFATVRGTAKGQKVDVRVGNFELQNPVKVLAGVAGEVAWTEQFPSVQLLDATDVKKLGAQERKKYVDQIRELLVAAEKAQNALNGQRLPASEEGAFYRLFLPKAEAAMPEGDCLVAGLVGQYKSKSCEPPASARAGGCAKCNTDVYGSNSPCLPISNGRVALNATEVCNQQTEENKYAVFQGVKSEEDVQRRSKDLAPLLTGLRDKCAGIQAGVSSGQKLSDQASACQNLENRIRELEAVNCQVLESHKNQFPDLQCHRIAPPTPIPDGPPPGPSTGGPATPPGPAGPPPGSEIDCQNLPGTPSSLRCDPSQVRSVTCVIDGNPCAKYYCECLEGQVGEKSNTTLDIACSAPRQPYQPGGPKKKSSSSWLIPALTAAAVIAIGVGAYYYFKPKKQKGVAWNDVSPVNTPVPPPLTPDLPAPVDIPRAAPGTR